MNRWKVMKQIPVTSNESDAFSKDLKHRGFSFVGSTVAYAYVKHFEFLVLEGAQAGLSRPKVYFRYNDGAALL